MVVTCGFLGRCPELGPGPPAVPGTGVGRLRVPTAGTVLAAQQWAPSGSRGAAQDPTLDPGACRQTAGLGPEGSPSESKPAKPNYSGTSVDIYVNVCATRIS